MGQKAVVIALQEWTEVVVMAIGEFECEARVVLIVVILQYLALLTEIVLGVSEGSVMAAAISALLQEFERGLVLEA